METKRKILKLLPVILLLGSCSMFDPVNENFSTGERLLKDPAYAEGLLAAAYSQLPTNSSYSLAYSDVATDNAVCNDRSNSFLRMATGQWSPQFDPMSQWSACLAAIQSINQFRSIIDTVPWRPDNPEQQELYRRRFHGESLALRAFFKFYLLQTVAGEDANGILSGIPIMNEYLSLDADFNTIQRATFEESVESIYDDITESLTYLTMDDYADVKKGDLLPSGYENFTIADFNAVFGSKMSQRISGRIVKALRTKVALLAASPAYNIRNSSVLWVSTARYAGELLRAVGGTDGLDPKGHRFYEKSNADALNLIEGKDMKEFLWRTTVTTSNNRELDNFPPSLFGNGRINPTQNLANAFPMANGYPILNLESGYDPMHPYDNRDPRLQAYILCNGDTYKGEIIRTGAGGKVNAKDSLPISTRSGYYLKKLLVEEANPNPVNNVMQRHFSVHIRYTELFLIYAEAANEAWGPDGDSGFGITPRSVIAAIRKRGGITQPDLYLNSIGGADKIKMREVIRNERRIELCFEGFRFWDLRRWNLPLNETANGVEIDAQDRYKTVEIEQRLYEEYMRACPIPYSEILKYKSLVQNKGW